MDLIAAMLTGMREEMARDGQKAVRAREDQARVQAEQADEQARVQAEQARHLV